MTRVSVIVIALNQEANIVPCLETVRWADDIVVVDSGSGDRTLELARGFTDRIFTIDWPGFGAAKNYALDQARGEWVFSLDTDERVSEALRDEITSAIAGRKPLRRLPGAPEELFRGPLDKTPGLVPGLHPAPVSERQGPFPGAGGARRGGR